MTDKTAEARPTRRVELASPRTIDGHEYAPDEVVELPVEDARRLVRDGRARWHDAAELDALDQRAATMPPASAAASGATRQTQSRRAAARPAGRSSGGSDA